MSNKHLKGIQKRKLRIKKILKKSSLKMRLSVYRSNRYLYAQLIDMDKNITLASVNEKELDISTQKKYTKSERAKLLGALIAQKTKKLKIGKIVFDRNGFRYHGRIQSLADEARKSGLEF